MTYYDQQIQSQHLYIYILYYYSFGPGAPHAKNMHFGFGCFGPGAPHAKNMHFGFGDSGVKICKKPRKNACFLHVGGFILLGFWSHQHAKNMHFFEVFCKFWLQNPQIQNACFLRVGPQGQNTQIQNACFLRVGPQGQNYSNIVYKYKDVGSGFVDHNMSYLLLLSVQPLLFLLFDWL